MWSGGAVFGDHVDVIALLSGLHRLRRNGDRIVQSRELQDRLNELAGPQARVFVFEGRLQLYCASLRIDTVIVEGQEAFRGIGLPLRIGEDFQRLGHKLADFRQARFGNGEGDVDGRDLVQLHQARRIVRLYEITDINHERAGTRIDGSVDIGVLELDPSGIDSGLVGIYRGRI